uniref:Uncharacterized protein n=1 Tax=Arundo donax TaxID=35708 RepID=A0A0A9FZ37_ARUDO
MLVLTLHFELNDLLFLWCCRFAEA